MQKNIAAYQIIKLIQNSVCWEMQTIYKLSPCMILNIFRFFIFNTICVNCQYFRFQKDNNAMSMSDLLDLTSRQLKSSLKNYSYNHLLDILVYAANVPKLCGLYKIVDKYVGKSFKQVQYKMIRYHIMKICCLLLLVDEFHMRPHVF